MSKKYSSKDLDAVYHALSSSPRRKMLTRLCKEGALPVGSLAEPMDMSLAAVSKHLSVLEQAGLISKQRQATTQYCSATLETVDAAAALVDFLRAHRQATAETADDQDAA